MKTIFVCALICVSAITLSAKDADYIVLDNQRELLINNNGKDSDKYKRMKENQLSVYNTIKTAEYKSARVFYQVVPKDSQDNEGNLTGNNYVDIAWFHEFPGGSFEIDNKKMFSKSISNISVTAEFPIYGGESRMVVTGTLPDNTYVITCTLYLIK